METPVAKSRGRPRKRRREDLSNGDVKVVDGKSFDVSNGGVKEDAKNTGNPRKRGRPPKTRAVVIKGESMVGRYLLKEFGGNGVFLGKIVSYDSGLYRVDYEDGDREDLDSGELREFVIGDERERFVGELLEKKKKLDEAIDKKEGVKVKIESEKGMKLNNEVGKGAVVEVVFALEKVDLSKLRARRSLKEVSNVVKMEASTLNEDPCDSDIDDKNDDEYCFDDDDDDEEEEEEEDDDSSSDAGEYGQGWETRAETEIPDIPPPELPPSSGSIGVPEEYVPHIFSVFGVLRTFSIHLFLSPFTLDDLVGCLKCKVPNTLLDAIHVALLRALKRHLEGLASEGSQVSSKCLRSIDWDALDIFTWPVYLFHYLMVMGHLNGQEWKGFYVDALDKEYFTLSIETKLAVLQILCDDALDTEEMRTEIDRLEESEAGVDSDGTFSNVTENGTRKMYPRSSKTFAGKHRDDVNSVAEKNVIRSSKTMISMKNDNHNRDTNDVGEDGNVDECRLCGMEGMLICCDGCPSAYHSRCIGVNKLSIPDGEWFCPECTISRIGPPITMGTSLRGAEVFGVDSYTQLFLGTCDHLLVLKVSVKASSSVRYYNCNDIPKVISALSSSPQHAVSYLGICQLISKYWELPQVVLSPFIINQASAVLQIKDENTLLPFQSHPSDENMNQTVLYKAGNETYASGVGENPIADPSGLGNEKFFLTSGCDDASLGAPVQSDLQSMGIGTMKQNVTNITSKLYEPVELSRTTLGLADKSSMAGISSCTPENNNSIVSSCNIGVCLPETHMRVKEDRNKAIARLAQKKKDSFLYMGSIFKPLAYINHYVHGAFAASAAANFAVLSSDENQPSGVHASDPRKAMAANILLQVKAFASAADRFFWPSTEKKLVEIPRERCSWCFHCTAPVISRKACLLNQAALNATRAEMKFISGLRLVKIVEGGLYGIAAYTLYMEESLHGLLVGPFRSLTYREQWRKKVEQASTCGEMKSLLLDLETNLCTISLSSEWTKLVDNWMDDSSIPPSVAASVPTQKRGAGKRKKHVAIPEVVADDSNEPNESSWWRGGKLAKLVFQRGTFPRGVVRKAARQGGKRRLPGIYYSDASDVPKRSRQFIWRAAVEIAKNASQLALQVRYLDQHIKWSDLVRPEQNLGDGKGAETDALAFRNAKICDKKILENKIMYGVAFGHQKHLSTRLMKSIIEKEESQDGEDKYWLLEARIPLYLIKEYEETADNTDPLPSVKPERYSKHQRRQLKASRKEIFVYLSRRKDGLHTCPCASCHGDVLLEHSITCNSCEGFCHKTCTMRSTEVTNDDIEFRVTCRKCSNKKFLPQLNNKAESPNSPLAMQGQEFQNSAAVAKSGNLKPSGQQIQNSLTAGKSMSSKSGSRQLPSVGIFDARSEKKSSNSSKSKNRASLHWGVIWKRKESDDGSDFQLRSVIFRCSSEGSTLKPECYLCHKPYNSSLMYICCETCQSWHHADAVNVDESKVSDLLGYKCCRCRRIRSPVCPYADAAKKTEVTKLRVRGPKEERVEANSVSEAISEQPDSFPSTPMSMMKMEEDVLIKTDDPLVLPVSKDDQMPDCGWNTSVSGPQKLQVRRHIKNEKDVDGLTWTDLRTYQLPTSAETSTFPNSNTGWDICDGGLEDGTTWNFDNLAYENDFEPQTYFSFTELLEVDGGNQMEGADISRGTWEDLPCENSQNGFMEQCNITSFDELMPKASTEKPIVDVLCEVCQVAAPTPDLTCQTCGIHMHRHCSPWDGENVIQMDNWRCGHCKEWC